MTMTDNRALFHWLAILTASAVARLLGSLPTGIWRILLQGACFLYILDVLIFRLRVFGWNVTRQKVLHEAWSAIRGW
jgi:hypothetical protein